MIKSPIVTVHFSDKIYITVIELSVIFSFIYPTPKSIAIL